MYVHENRRNFHKGHKVKVVFLISFRIKFIRPPIPNRLQTLFSVDRSDFRWILFVAGWPLPPNATQMPSMLILYLTLSVHERFVKFEEKKLRFEYMPRQLVLFFRSKPIFFFFKLHRYFYT